MLLYVLLMDTYIHTLMMPCKAPTCIHQKQRGALGLAQGHFGTWTGKAGTKPALL